MRVRVEPVAARFGRSVWAGLGAIVCGVLMCSSYASPLEASPVRRIVSTLGVHHLVVRNLIVDMPGWQSESLTSNLVGCLHDYALKPSDLIKLQAADLLIANGGGMESHRLISAIGKLPPSRRLDIAAGLKPQLVGQADRKADHVDPHFYVDPHLMPKIIVLIATALQGLTEDPREDQKISANQKNFIGRLQRLQENIAALRPKAHGVPVVVAAQNIHRLITTSGFSIEEISLDPEFKQPTGKELAQLLVKIQANAIPLIFYDRDFDNPYVKRLVEATAIRRVAMDAILRMHADAPLTYYEDAMLKNLQVMEQALQGVLPQLAEASQ